MVKRLVQIMNQENTLNYELSLRYRICSFRQFDHASSGPELGLNDTIRPLCMCVPHVAVLQLSSLTTAYHQRNAVNYCTSLTVRRLLHPTNIGRDIQLSALISSRRASVPPCQSGGRASVHSTDHSSDITTNVKQRVYKQLRSYRDTTGPAFTNTLKTDCKCSKTFVFL
ncbi:hypothetical protein M513_05624, partial [Trichuris suis]